MAEVTQRISQAFDSTALKNMQQSVKDLAAISGRLVKFANAQTDPRRPRQPERGDDLGRLRGRGEDVPGRGGAARHGHERPPARGHPEQRPGLQRRLRQAAADLRSVMTAARENQASLIRVIQQADTLMSKLQQGNGTLGMLDHRLDPLPRDHRHRHSIPRAADGHPGEPEEVPEDLGVLMSKRRAELEVSAGGIVFRRVPEGSPVSC